MKKYLKLIIPVVGGAIVVGIILALVFLSKKNEVATVDEEIKTEFTQAEWSGATSECLYSKDEVKYCENLKKVLEETISSSKDENARTEAAIYLALLNKAQNFEKAVEILEETNDGSLSDANQYNILNTLADFYQEREMSDEYVETLKKIVELPETMKLETEDWTMVRKLILLELKQMGEEYEG